MNRIFRDIEKMEIGDLIKLYREHKGVSQEELAEAVGVSSATISNYENKKTIPDVLTLRNIILLLKIPTDYIFLREYADVKFVLYHMDENIMLNEYNVPVTDRRSHIVSRDLDMYANSRWNFCCIEVLGNVYFLCDYNEAFDDGIVLAKRENDKFYRFMNKCGKTYTDVLSQIQYEDVSLIAGRVLGEISEYKIIPSI